MRVFERCIIGKASRLTLRDSGLIAALVTVRIVQDLVMANVSKVASLGIPRV